MSDFQARFCLLCGNPLENQRLYGEIRPACPACGWVYFADPKVAAAVIVEQDGKVLLTRRVNDPYRGDWSLPAGFVNAMEDPAAAAARECREETGLTVEITALVEVIAGREHRRGADIVIVYRGRIVAGALQAGDDADAVGFFEYAALPPLAFLATRKVLLGNIKQE